MSAIRMQATVQEVDIPYIERVLKDIASDITFEEQDFYYELSSEDLVKLEIAKQQSKEGKTISMEEMLDKLEAKYGV